MSGINNVQELGKAFEDFKAYHSKIVNEKASETEVTLKDEIHKASEDTLKKYDELKAEHEKAQKAIDSLATQVNRVGNAYEENSSEAKAQQKSLAYFNNARRIAWAGKALSNDRAAPVDWDAVKRYKASHEAWVRYGDQYLTPDQTKAMAVGSDPDGGVWLQPPERSTEIVTRVFETSPMRQISNVIQIATHSYQIPMDPNRMPTGGWVSEMQPRAQTATPTLAIKEIVPQEIYAQPAVTQIMLEDAGFDVEGYIANKASQAFGLDTNTAFVVGTGVGQPRGFLTYPAGSNGDGTNKWGEIEQIGTGTSGAFTYLGFLKIITAFRSDRYYANARWLMNRQSVVPVMQLQNPAGQYIFVPVNNGQFNETPLLGYPITYATDMPAVAAGALAAAFGDFRESYTIVDRVGISTLRDNLTAKPFTLFYLRMRVGGDITNFDSLKLLKLT